MYFAIGKEEKRGYGGCFRHLKGMRKCQSHYCQKGGHLRRIWKKTSWVVTTWKEKLWAMETCFKKLHDLIRSQWKWNMLKTQVHSSTDTFYFSSEVSRTNNLHSISMWFKIRPMWETQTLPQMRQEMRSFVRSCFSTFMQAWLLRAPGAQIQDFHYHSKCTFFTLSSHEGLAKISKNTFLQVLQHIFRPFSLSTKTSLTLTELRITLQLHKIFCCNWIRYSEETAENILM